MCLRHSVEFLDKPEITSILFYPRSYYSHCIESQEVITLQIPVDDNVFIDGRIYCSPEANTAVILYFHGNGETVSDYDGIAPYYTKLGLTLFVVDYRGYGLSSSSPTATTLISDATAIYHQINQILGQQDIKNPSIFVMGRSLGSAAAIEVAYQAGQNISGLIIESGFAYTFDLLYRLGGFSFYLPSEDNGFRNLEKIGYITVPCLFIHGKQDNIIPITDTLALQRACRAHYKLTLTISQASHNDLFSCGLLNYFNAIYRFIRDISQERYD